MFAGKEAGKGANTELSWCDVKCPSKNLMAGFLGKHPLKRVESLKQTLFTNVFLANLVNRTPKFHSIITSQ